MEGLKNSRCSEDKPGDGAKPGRSGQTRARVLIADDNQTSLDAAAALMKACGIKADCVDSGQKAVAAVAAGNFRYDAIFTDYMMPGMDGIETARAIRDIGTDYASKVPIIALTADVADGNEEMFLRNGFKAFMTKPIDISRLDEVLADWVREPEKTPPGAVKLEGRRIPGLDIGKGIKRFGGDEDAYIDVLRSFAANTRNLLKSPENAGGEMPDGYAIAVHSIKGSSRSIFAGEVGDEAEKLENACKAGDFDYISAHNREFTENTRSLIREIEDMLAAVSGDGRKQMKDEPDAGILSGLLAACEAFDMEGVCEALKELEKFEYRAGNELVLRLRENADMTDYTEMARRLSEYSRSLPENSGPCGV